jgi:predicted RNA-binding protein
LSARGRKTEKILLDNFASIARKQMKSDAWTKDLRVKGKPPRYRLESGQTQMALWSIERSGFSLPKAVIPMLAELNALPEIHLHSDVVWKGDVFGPLVESFDPTIRAGSDLLVYQGGSVIGLARANAPAWEWPTTPGRLAKSHQRL